MTGRPAKMPTHWLARRDALRNKWIATSAQCRAALIASLRHDAEHYRDDREHSLAQACAAAADLLEELG